MKVLKQHGTMVVVNHCGILLLGKHGAGKSLLALALIKNKHKLVSDDLVIISRKGDTLTGSAPHKTKNILYLPDIGLLNINAFAGHQSTIDAYPIHGVVQLTQAPIKHDYKLEPKYTNTTLLGVDLPTVAFHSLQKHLSLLLESFAFKLTTAMESPDDQKANHINE